ncbi:GNAT family N-acetyltransferase [Streptomyces sp. NPDC059092]|uniref:GNAT family N-acetyltransferase n=1 Tax=Streptomyces sp. NPDC059092 TaxID=3346725 RepID=UPI0036B1F513
MPSVAWWTPLPLRQQSRRFSRFTCGRRRARRRRTCLWDVLCACFPSGRSSPFLRRSGQANITHSHHPSGRGRGLATRALLFVSHYTANEGREEAVIQVAPENPASTAVARRAGFAPGKQPHSKDGTQFHWYIRDLRVAPQQRPTVTGQPSASLETHQSHVHLATRSRRRPCHLAGFDRYWKGRQPRRVGPPHRELMMYQKSQHEVSIGTAGPRFEAPDTAKITKHPHTP